eukprot:549041-Rhodomonas_salina.1
MGLSRRSGCVGSGEEECRQTPRYAFSDTPTLYITHERDCFRCLRGQISLPLPLAALPGSFLEHFHSESHSRYLFLAPKRALLLRPAQGRAQGL